MCSPLWAVFGLASRMSTTVLNDLAVIAAGATASDGAQPSVLRIDNRTRILPGPGRRPVLPKNGSMVSRRP
jgi:hypothetical protein